MSIVDVQQRNADSIVELTRLAVSAPTVPAAVSPMLEHLVERTAAVGSAYFEAGGGAFFARSGTGIMPSGPAMEAILTHGLPSEAPLLLALASVERPLLFDDTSSVPAAAGFPDLGVPSLAAAPVRDGGGALLGAFLMHTFTPHCWTEREADLFAAVTGTMAGLTARLIAEERAIAAQEDALRALGLALEVRDGETKGHTDRVTRLVERTGAALGLSDADQAALRWGAYLHDIGKIGIPDTILHKPGKLTESEWEVMRAHASMGHDFAARLTFLPTAVLNLVRYHHERWDGKGYPEGRAGVAIPLPARIFAVCDVYDALVSERPYKHAWTHAEAVTEIAGQSGRQFDPRVVVAFLAVVAES